MILVQQNSVSILLLIKIQDEKSSPRKQQPSNTQQS